LKIKVQFLNHSERTLNTLLKRTNKMATAADILGATRHFKIPARWGKHYQRLCEERDRLMARDCSTCETSRAKLDDLAEAAAEESQRSLSLVAASATQNTIFEVLAAIRRIERGTYGLCEITGEPIESERLRAIPWTRYSFRGQNEVEKGGYDRKYSLPALKSLSEDGFADEEEGEQTEEEEAA
jgi:RNA polymerase-binding transcription factor DksA